MQLFLSPDTIIDLHWNHQHTQTTMMSSVLVVWATTKEKMAPIGSDEDDRIYPEMGYPVMKPCHSALRVCKNNVPSVHGRPNTTSSNAKTKLNHQRNLSLDFRWDDFSFLWLFVGVQQHLMKVVSRLWCKQEIFKFDCIDICVYYGDKIFALWSVDEKKSNKSLRIDKVHILFLF